MTDEKIARINELAKKAKAEGLTPAEQAEQKAREAQRQAQQQVPDGYPGGDVPPWAHPGSANQG